jgi:hypothetical protein
MESSLVVIPAKHGEAVREPGSSKRMILRVLSGLAVYWIPASAGMTSEFTALQLDPILP